MEWKGMERRKGKERKGKERIGKERKEQKRTGRERKEESIGKNRKGMERKERKEFAYPGTAGPTRIAQTIPRSQQPESADDEVMPVDRLQVQEPFFLVGW